MAKNNNKVLKAKSEQSKKKERKDGRKGGKKKKEEYFILHFLNSPFYRCTNKLLTVIQLKGRFAIRVNAHSKMCINLIQEKKVTDLVRSPTASERKRT